MNGGKLIQNVSDHAIYGTHTIIDSATKEEFQITSTHHQMQYPYTLNKNHMKILMYSNGKSMYYEGLILTTDQIYTLHNMEPEVVLYTVPNKPKCLAIQGHPEYMRKDCPIIAHLNKLINNL